MCISVVEVCYILVDTTHVCIAGVGGLVSSRGSSYACIRKLPPRRSRIVWYRLVVGLLWVAGWVCQLHVETVDPSIETIHVYNMVGYYIMRFVMVYVM